MGLITKLRGRVKKHLRHQNRRPSTSDSGGGLTYQQEQIFGQYLNLPSQPGSSLSEFWKIPSPHGVYYNLLGCPRAGKKSYYNYDCDFQKNPETLVVLLLLPLFMGRIGLLYACILYQYPLHNIYDWVKKWVWTGLSHIRGLCLKLYASLHKCEMLFVHMNLYCLVNQMVFFMICDRAVGLHEKERVTSLYSLLFYNVLTYCFSYVKEVMEKETWDMNVNLSPSSQVRHLAMTSTKILLEWIKAVTFIVTVVCMLLVLGLEQGLDHYCPTRFYLTITLVYYILTERLIQDALPNCLHILIPTNLVGKRFVDEISGLEKPFSTLIIKLFTILLNLLVLLLPTLQPPVLPFSIPSLKIALVTFYFNVWLQAKSLSGLKEQLEEDVGLTCRFRMASDEEVQERQDDVCSICLTSFLGTARATPCQHLFHTGCLRLWIKAAGNFCPICKRDFHFD